MSNAFGIGKISDLNVFVSIYVMKLAFEISKPYEKHVLLGLNRVYYWIYKCTTCHHYTNIIKTI